MRVRLLPEFEAKYADLDRAEEYDVLGEELSYFRVINRHGRPYLYEKWLFEVVDPTVPSAWIIVEVAPGERYAYPPELSEIGFFERLFDGDHEAVRVFSKFVRNRAL